MGTSERSRTPAAVAGDGRQVVLTTTKFDRFARNMAEAGGIRDGGTPPCSTVRNLLDDRIADIDATVAELLTLRKTLIETG